MTLNPQEAEDPTSASIVAALNKSDVLSIPSRIGKCQLSLDIDTGAAVNVISENSFKMLTRTHGGSRWQVRPSDLSLSGINGKHIELVGVVTLQVRFSKSSTPFRATFYIASSFTLPADGLLGLTTLRANNIKVFTGNNSIEYHGRTYHAMQHSHPLLQHKVSVATSSTGVGGLAKEQLGQTTESQFSITTPPGGSSDTLCECGPNGSLVPAVLSGGQGLHSQEVTKITVRLPTVKEGTDVVCLSESARIKGVSLEPTLTRVRENNVTDIFILNEIKSIINLKKGDCLGDFLVYHQPVVDEPESLTIGNIQATPEREATSDSRQKQMEQHVKIIDYPESRDDLLTLLANFQEVIALPGEQLGKTTLASHHIKLKPGAEPSFTPAYRLPHKHRNMVDGMVKDMLREEIIKHSYSPWNSPLFLVPKKDGGWRPVIDYRKVNQQTVKDRYPLPVLSTLLQSLGEENKVFSSLDLLSGYWQIPLHKRSTEVTAFSTGNGHFEFLRMPFGLSDQASPSKD